MCAGASTNTAVPMTCVDGMKFCEQESTDNFSDANKVGHGAYGIVYRGELRSSNVAIKMLSTVRSNKVDVYLLPLLYTLYMYRLLLEQPVAQQTWITLSLRLTARLPALNCSWVLNSQEFLLWSLMLYSCTDFDTGIL